MPAPKNRKQGLTCHILTDVIPSASSIEENSATVRRKPVRFLFRIIPHQCPHIIFRVDLAQGTTAAITLNSVPVNLSSLLEAVIRTFARQAEQKRIVLTTEFDEYIPQIHADPVKLSWAVSNLIGNALRYTPPDGAIALSAKLTARGIQLQVRDTGPGIAPEVQHRLFERFAQGHMNRAEAGSAGLGLAIVKDIVQAHGGRIFVDAIVGKGTCFTVELPICEEFSAEAANR